ncbi:MAG TPA: ATP-binding protein, partial [Motilibacteraceae bacterium]|nr:ATP-binding protein [Motilibacteraceae bacterium]
LFALETPASLPDLDAEVEDAAYKICLEAMTNVLRHSDARHCRVRLSAREDRLELEVADDGCGLGRSSGGGGTGLTSMRERATAVGGDLLVEDEAAGGTRVLSRLPLRADPDGTRDLRETALPLQPSSEAMPS